MTLFTSYYWFEGSFFVSLLFCPVNCKFFSLYSCSSSSYLYCVIVVILIILGYLQPMHWIAYQINVVFSTTDFGMVGEFKQELRDGFIQACLHLVNRDYDALAKDFITLGYKLMFPFNFLIGQFHELRVLNIFHLSTSQIASTNSRQGCCYTSINRLTFNLLIIGFSGQKVWRGDINLSYLAFLYIVWSFCRCFSRCYRQRNPQYKFWGSSRKFGSYHVLLKSLAYIQ